MQTSSSELLWPHSHHFPLVKVKPAGHLRFECTLNGGLLYIETHTFCVLGCMKTCVFIIFFCSVNYPFVLGESGVWQAGLEVAMLKVMWYGLCMT